MGAIDLLLIVVAAAAVFFGWRKGLVAKLGKLIGILAGIVCTRLWAPALARAVFGTPSPGDSADVSLLTTVVAYVAVFLVVYIVVALLCSGLRGILRLAHISILDRIGGALFTLFEYMLLMSLALNLWVAIFPDSTIRSHPMVNGGCDIIGTSVLNLAPDILGSEEVETMLDKAWSAIDSDCDKTLPF